MQGQLVCSHHYKASDCELFNQGCMVAGTLLGSFCPVLQQTISRYRLLRSSDPGDTLFYLQNTVSSWTPRQLCAADCCMLYLSAHLLAACNHLDVLVHLRTWWMRALPVYLCIEPFALLPCARAAMSMDWHLTGCYSLVAGKLQSPVCSLLQRAGQQGMWTSKISPRKRFCGKQCISGTPWAARPHYR